MQTKAQGCFLPVYTRQDSLSRPFHGVVLWLPCHFLCMHSGVASSIALCRVKQCLLVLENVRPHPPHLNSLHIEYNTRLLCSLTMMSISHTLILFHLLLMTTPLPDNPPPCSVPFPEFFEVISVDWSYHLHIVFPNLP